jgi:hypothetical protein
MKDLEKGTIDAKEVARLSSQMKKTVSRQEIEAKKQKVIQLKKQ